MCLVRVYDIFLFNNIGIDFGILGINYICLVRIQDVFLLLDNEVDFGKINLQVFSQVNDFVLFVNI